MSKKGVVIGIIITIVAIGGILAYTNIFELAKPGIKSSVDTAKDAISKVEGKDVVEKAEEVSTQVKNVTDQIEVTNPLYPLKNNYAKLLTVIGLGFEIIAFGIIFLYQKLPSTTRLNIEEAKKSDPSMLKIPLTTTEAVGFTMAALGLIMQMLALIFF